MWRYGRRGRGHTRKFYQWNIDLIGADSPQADAELATTAESFLREVGLRLHEVRIFVSQRRLMESEL